jgi:hypothetical protein
MKKRKEYNYIDIQFNLYKKNSLTEAVINYTMCWIPFRTSFLMYGIL